MPHLGAARHLIEQERDDVAGIHRGSFERDAEARLGEVASEDARVVAVTLHGARVARDAVPLQAERRLHQRSGKVHPGQGRAFPVRRLRGQPALAEDGNAKLRQVAQRRDETCCGDDVVDLEDERAAVGGALGVDPICRTRLFDRLDRRVQDHDPAGERPVFIWLDITRAHADQRARVH